MIKVILLPNLVIIHANFAVLLLQTVRRLVKSVVELLQEVLIQAPYFF